MLSSESTPIMPSSSPKLHETIPDSSSALPTRTITFLGIGRVLLGAATLLAPTTAGKLFFIPITGTTIPFARCFGAREIVLGELLLTARDKREIKRGLAAGAAADALDVGTLIFAFAQGQMSKMGAGLFGGGAAAFAFLGLYGLRSMH